MGQAARHGPDDGDELFRAAVEDAAPLADRDRRRSAPDGGAPRRGAGASADRAAPLTVDESGRSARAPGVNRRTLTDLAAGRIPVQATLDLHRHTFASARERLTRFLSESRSAGLRCVLVITGKAERSPAPRLRDHVPEWLAGPLAGSILAFAPARAEQGGPGALVVLLRDTRR